MKNYEFTKEMQERTKETKDYETGRKQLVRCH